MALDATEHLEQLRGDARSEIRQRIEQRDKYSIQLTIAVAAVFAIAYSEHGTARMLFAAPIASLYYTVLILYSYAIHDVLAGYLRDRIEPSLAQRVGIDPSGEWETYYSTRTRPGIRRQFFMWAHWAIAVGSCFLAIYDRIIQEKDPVIEIVLAVAIVIASLLVVRPEFWERGAADAASQRANQGVS